MSDERRVEREEQNKILEPHELSPAMMRHACIAAVGYLTGSSIQNKEQMIATLREAVTTPGSPATTMSGDNLNHHGPIDGYCFIGLNFTEEQFERISGPIVEAMKDKSTEFCTEEAIVQLIERARRAGENREVSESEWAQDAIEREEQRP